MNPSMPTWVEAGMLVHDVGVIPPRIWRATNLMNLGTRVEFDAICIATETLLQGYQLQPNAPQPGGWRVVNEMEALALNAMSATEYRTWQTAWYKSKNAWHHRDEK
jgi:hypothetical protein